VILEALLKWEDKLLGRAFTLVTDNKGLEYFQTQQSLSAQQARWWEYLSRFNFTTIHVPGKLNKVADLLSRYYSDDTPEDRHPDHVYVNTDAHLDPEGETLPVEQFIDLQAVPV
jgi:hypothetical protein